MSISGCRAVTCRRKQKKAIQKIPFCFVTVEADEEMKESETSRGLSDEEKKQQPSELLMTLEKGFSAIANIITDEVNA